MAETGKPVPGKSKGRTPTKQRSTAAQALTDSLYRQRKVKPKKGKGSYKRPGAPEPPEQD